jgi:hypothetical protein
MKRCNSIKCSLLIIFLFIAAAITSAQITADEICKKNIEKMGGESLLNTLSNVKFEQQILMNNQEFPQKMNVINNKAIKIETIIPGNSIIVALKDSTGWQVNPYSGSNSPKSLSKDEVRMYKMQTDLLGALFNYKQKNITITLEGKKKVLGKDAYKLNLVYKNGYKTNVYVSAKDFFVVEIEDMFREVFFSNYKKESGFYFPFATEVKTKMGSTIINVFKIQVNQAIDEKIFDMPTKL